MKIVTRLIFCHGLKSVLLSLCWSFFILPAHASDFDAARLLGTGGVSQVEGAGGGGLSPWALITGYGSRDGVGATAFLTHLQTQDYRLTVKGVGVGWHNRIEGTIARQQFSAHFDPLKDLRLEQDIVGLKMRLVGDAILDQGSWMPQVSMGLLYKNHNGVNGLSSSGGTSVKQFGAPHTRGIDLYVAMSKLELAHSFLWNLSLRSTNANQMGLLGFGADGVNGAGSGRSLYLEGNVTRLLNRHWLAGIEYRQKPRQLKVDPEQSNYDIFVAWVPNKHHSLTLAWVRLGQITQINPKNQHGLYLSWQLAL